MNTKIIFRSTFVALCLIGMLALPAAAAQTGQVPAVKGNTIDKGLIDDLWANHQQFRLQRFDTNVEQANGVITILSKYGIDTAACQITLSTISSKRADLESALSSRDREKLKTVNKELKTLWQQFRKDVKDAIRGHYGKGESGNPAALTSSGPGMLTA